MKQIEEIENMDWQELEKAALQEDIPLPAGFEKRLTETLAAKRVVSATPQRKKARRILWSSLAAAAAAAALIALSGPRNQEPEDTFDDPRLAYAEVEKVFELISDKMKVIYNEE